MQKNFKLISPNRSKITLKIKTLWGWGINTLIEVKSKSTLVKYHKIIRCIYNNKRFLNFI